MSHPVPCVLLKNYNMKLNLWKRVNGSGANDRLCGCYTFQVVHGARGRRNHQSKMFTSCWWEVWLVDPSIPASTLHDSWIFSRSQRRRRGVWWGWYSHHFQNFPQYIVGSVLYRGGEDSGYFFRCDTGRAVLVTCPIPIPIPPLLTHHPTKTAHPSRSLPAPGSDETHFWLMTIKWRVQKIVEVPVCDFWG